MLIVLLRTYRQRHRANERRDFTFMLPITSTITKIVLQDSSPVQLIESECSCVAGKALCNHTVALLYQSATYSQQNLTAVPPVLSCTETEQRWHKPRTLGVKPGRVSEMVVLSAKPKQRTVGNGVRSTLYKAVAGELPDLDVLKVDEVYKDIPADTAPSISTMSISVDVPLVMSAFGLVQEGSPLSYQHPVPASRCIVLHPDAPPPPPLPLDGHRLEPSSCQWVYSLQEQLHLQSLAISLEMAWKIEAATRKQSESAEWHRVRRDRVTSSHFREICHVRGTSSAEKLANRMIKGVVQTPQMKRGLALEPAAIKEYCRIQNTNYWPCGIIIHPDAPWIGSSPDGLVFDPKENPPFGLIEIKCPNVNSYVDCNYLKAVGDTMELKKSHAYFWQTQGQLLVSGMEWCDFVVCAKDDMVIQRIYRDDHVGAIIREKGDLFFFTVYMPVSLSLKRD